jgi:sigma-54 dependent transcriptional regulator, acetoin dehydrogenase operon transcriptional activator AcoR
MSKNQSLRTNTETARRIFFDEGKSPGDLVPDFIARSWQRCVQRLDDRRPPPVHRIDSYRLRERQEARARLRRKAGPEMDALAELVSDAGCMVLLADQDGLILDAAGGLDFLRKAEQIALEPGVLWSEEGRGTNAIGTALAERRPLAVWGLQHYLEEIGILGCAAAPIFSPRGESIGVLDVSGNFQQMCVQLLGTVRLAAQIVEHRLIADAAGSATLLRFHGCVDMLNSYREGVLIIDDRCIVGANSGALRLLGTRWEDLLDTSADQWLRFPKRVGRDGVSVLEGRDGQRFHGVVEPRPSSQIAVSTRGPSAAIEEIPARGMTAALDSARRVVDAGVAVLVVGETGAGKEVAARRVHAASSRNSGPFIAVNCAALPETLIESELFGYEGGAFTGARRKGKLGRIRAADGGTLFLDEIGDMPPTLQARLLRALQDRSVVPLGGDHAVAVDFALICATNRDLGALVRAGTFRADLYYRINGFTLDLLPLRERPDRRQFIADILNQLGGGDMDVSLSPDALEAMAAYRWPGNLRQLNSVLRTMIALATPGEVVGRDRLPREIFQCEAQPAPSPHGNDLHAHTRHAIEQALAECNGCVSAAARRLGIHRSTIYRWLARRNLLNPRHPR